MPDKKRLFAENDDWTDEALHLVHETAEKLRPLFEKYEEMGFSFREISHVMSSALTELELSEALKRFKK